MNERPDIFIGADPDLNTPALAAVSFDGKLAGVNLVRVEGKSKSWDAVVDCSLAIRGAAQRLTDSIGAFRVIAAAVEGQEIAYTAMTGANPRSIMFLANSAGCLLQEISVHTDHLYFPAPKIWKGDVPKRIHQCRVLAKLGIEYEQCSDYARPAPTLSIPGTDGLRKTDWKHLVDAIGLAVWARDRYLTEQRRAKR